MAMSGDALGTMIKSKLGEIAKITNDAEATKFANALGEAIVDYLKANATVTGTVTTGQGAGGVVQGAIT